MFLFLLVYAVYGQLSSDTLGKVRFNLNDVISQAMISPVQRTPVQRTPVQPTHNIQFTGTPPQGGNLIYPVQPTPVQPTPVQPTPVQPTPVQPTPVQPTHNIQFTGTPLQGGNLIYPVQPTPVQPTPVQPTPVQPTPVQPTPVQPTPVQPTHNIQFTGTPPQELPAKSQSYSEQYLLAMACLVDKPLPEGLGFVINELVTHSLYHGVTGEMIYRAITAAPTTADSTDKSSQTDHDSNGQSVSVPASRADAACQTAKEPSVTISNSFPRKRKLPPAFAEVSSMPPKRYRPASTTPAMSAKTPSFEPSNYKMLQRKSVKRVAKFPSLLSTREPSATKVLPKTSAILKTKASLGQPNYTKRQEAAIYTPIRREYSVAKVLPKASVTWGKQSPVKPGATKRSLVEISDSEEDQDGCHQPKRTRDCSIL